MQSWLATLIAALAAVFAAESLSTASAQVDSDVVVVTANMIRNESLDDEERAPGVRAPAGPPYISLLVPADFVMFTVTLETATRSTDARVKELEAAFKLLADRVAKSKDVKLEAGFPGRSAAVETTAAKEVVVNDGDRSSIPLVLKFATQKGDTFGTVRGRAEKFIGAIQVNGRVEAVTGDLQYIGVTEPKKHREALLRKIADDAKLLQTIFVGAGSQPPAISMTGLEGRVLYRPSGPLELEMYIPYSIVLGSPQPQR